MSSMEEMAWKCGLLFIFLVTVVLIVAYEAYWEKREEEAKKRHEARMREYHDWEKFFDYLDSQDYFMSESRYRDRHDIDEKRKER